MPLASLV
jgi:hypothetical protein